MNFTTRRASFWPPCIWPWRPPSSGCRRSSGGFHQVRSHLDAIETQLRCLAHELRPTILDDLGLLPALQSLVQRVAERTKLCIRVDSALAGRLAPAAEQLSIASCKRA